MKTADNIYHKLKCQYAPLLGVTALLVIFCGISVKLCNYHFRKIDKLNYDKFLNNECGYTPLIDGLGWENHAIYDSIFNFAGGKNLILIGSSNSREGIVPEQMSLPAGWKITNLSFGADTIDSFMLMSNYVNGKANHKPDKSDLVVLHVFYGIFKPNSYKYLKNRIELFNIYSVADDSLEVKGDASGLERKLKIINYKIRRIYLELLFPGQNIDNFYGFKTYAKQKIKNIIKKQKDGNTSLEKKERIKKYVEFWKDYSSENKIPGEETEKFKKYLLQLKAVTNVAVVNMYLPTWHENICAQKQYKKWYRNDLIPFLKINRVPLIDVSGAIADDDYCDSAHLYYRGRKHYTGIFNGAIDKIIDSIDGGGQDKT